MIRAVELIISMVNLSYYKSTTSDQETTVRFTLAIIIAAEMTMETAVRFTLAIIKAA